MSAALTRDALHEAAITAAGERDGFEDARTTISLRTWHGGPMLTLDDPRRGAAAVVMTPDHARLVASGLMQLAEGP